MSGDSPHTILRDGVAVGALYALPGHGRVCLHTEDPDLVHALLKAGAVAPSRPPFLDAAADGVHGAYHPKPQINWFFDDSLVEVVEALRPAARAAGFQMTAPPASVRD